MNLLVLSCKTMRDGLVVSGFFLVTALCLLIAVRYLVPPIFYLPQITTGLAVLLLLLSPVILISTYVARVHLQKNDSD